MKKIRFMDTSFRDGFQSVLGARVKTDDFLPALEAAVDAGIDNFEIGGGARFQSLYFYCQEDAFEMMDKCRETVGPDVNLQTLARGVNVVGLISQPRDMIDLHAKLFKKHGVSTIRNFDALNDVRNLDYSGRCIHNNGLHHQVSVTMMGLPPGLSDSYAHSPQFYADCLQNILDADIPFDSVCFKDASGTSTPVVVHETIKKAKQMLPDDMDVEFHTHCTAGTASNCLMAAIEGGADLIDLSMEPVSGGTGHVDILTMWHLLKGTDYTLDIDYEKILKAEDKFKECMEKYYFPPESKETNPTITLSPMPGGALTANTQMMRDNDCLHLYPQVIKEMRDVVARGGFGTSVTPVSQFYFQQAFSNVMQGSWKNISEGYGKMVLGYYGHTPTEPDEEIVKLASEQLNLEPTTEDPVDINDRNPDLGTEAAKKKLQQESLEETEENIFIVGACGNKGIDYLNGKAELGVRYKESESTGKAAEKSEKEEQKTQPSAAAGASEPGAYNISVNGKQYYVEVAPAQSGDGSSAGVEVKNAAPAETAPSAASGEAQNVEAPMPGKVVNLLVEKGQQVDEGQALLTLESMKMEVEVKSSTGGTVKDILVGAGEKVESGQAVVSIG